MITGTVILEDHIMSFKMIYTSDVYGVEVTIGDNVTGKQLTKLLPPEVFAAVLGIALHPEGRPANAEEIEEAWASELDSPRETRILS